MGFFKNLKEDLSDAVNDLIPVGENDDKTRDNEAEDTVSKATEDHIETMDVLEEDNDGVLTKTSDERVGDTNNSPIPPVARGNNEVTIIARGTLVNGNINSEGSLDVKGAINGDIDCQGKLSVMGRINGNCSANEVYIASDRLIGSIISENNIRIDYGAVIIGDISASTGIIAGAVKGDIDINGAIVLDSTAIVKGNIKAKSIQINKGAIFEGNCSLAYAEVDIDSIFA